MEHKEYNSSLRPRHFRSPLLSIINAQPLEVRCVDKVYAAGASHLFGKCGILSHVTIGPRSDVVAGPPHLHSLLNFRLRNQFHFLQIDSPTNYLRLLILALPGNLISLKVELKYQTIGACKLYPNLFYFIPELPCPVEVLD